MFILERFIGYHIDKRFENFSGIHTKESFEKSLLNESSEWYYRDKIITYERNELGHRSKSIDQIDLDNYLLFTGCSFTEGIGNLLEDTYPYLVSQKNNIDYYNLGLGGSGIDAMFFNLIQWISHVPKKPKALIVQWPNIARFLSFRPHLKEAVTQQSHNNFLAVHDLMVGNKNVSVESNGIWSKLDDVEKFLVLGESPDVNYFSSRKYFISLMIRSLFKEIPIIFISLGERDLDFDLEFLIKDRACDNSHPGVKSNQILSDDLSILLKSKGII